MPGQPPAPTPDFQSRILDGAKRLGSATVGLAGVTIAVGLAASGIVPCIWDPTTFTPFQTWLTGLGANALSGWLAAWSTSKASRFRQAKDQVALAKELATDLRDAVAADPKLGSDLATLLSETQAISATLREMEAEQLIQTALLEGLSLDARRSDQLKGRLHRLEIRELRRVEKDLGAKFDALPAAVTAEVRKLLADFFPARQAGALHQIPQPVLDFVGRRAEIDEVADALEANKRTAIAAIVGMPGLGKTELAYAIADELLPTFPDAQILLALGGVSRTPPTSEATLQAVIRAFDPQAQLPDDLAGLEASYRSLLHGKRVLILADNARDAAQVRALIPPAGSALLITSRNRFALPGMYRLDLSALSEKEAADLLLNICSRIGSHARQLARLCAYLPLALRVSASLLEANDTRSVTRYLTQLDAERLKHLRDPDNSDDPAASVEASLRLSYDTLDPSTQQVLTQLSVFPASFDLDAAESVVDAPGDLEDHMDLLRRRSLLEYEPGTKRFSLHDLVRAFAAARLPVSGPASRRHAQHYATVLVQAYKLFEQGGEHVLASLALFDAERANTDAAWAWLQQHASDSAGDHLLLTYADMTSYIGQLRYDNRRETIPRLLAVLTATKRLDDRGGEARSLGSLGVAYRLLGEVHRAIECHEQSIALARAIGDRRQEARTLRDLGAAYRSLGEVHRAIECHEQSVVLARAIGDRRQEGRALGGLGAACLDLDEVGRAIEYFEQSVAIARASGDRGQEGWDLGNLGAAYHLLGEVHRAIECHEQSIALARAIGDASEEGRVLKNLGAALLGEARRAIEDHEQRVPMGSAIGDGNEEGIALALGIDSDSLGEPRKAIKYLEQRLAIQHEIENTKAEIDATALEQRRQQL